MVKCAAQLQGRVVSDFVVAANLDPYFSCRHHGFESFAIESKQLVLPLTNLVIKGGRARPHDYPAQM